MSIPARRARHRLAAIGCVTALAAAALVGADAPAAGTFPGANGLIVFSGNPPGGDSEIYVMAATPSAEPVQLTDNSVADFDPAWSPDGRRIAFASVRDGWFDLYVMDADGSNVTRLTEDEVYDSEPVFSPHGDRIAFTRMTAGEFAIWVMDSDGSNSKAVSTLPAPPGDPWPSRGQDEGASWSPDGTRIAFWTKRSGTGDVYTMNPDGSGQRGLAVNTDEVEKWPEWSPDGSRIVLTAVPNDSPSTSSELVVRSLDGAPTPQLDPVGTGVGPATWSPDGSQVAYVGTGLQLYTVPADGDGVATQLTFDDLHHNSLDWQPVVSHRPDLRLRPAQTRRWVGNDLYAPTPQRLSATMRPGGTVAFLVRVQNDAPNYDTVRLRGTRGTTRFRVRYLLAGAEVTRTLVNGTFTVTDLPGGALAPAVRIEVTVTKHAPRGSKRTVEVLATPLGADGPRDVVSITVTRRR